MKKNQLYSFNILFSCILWVIYIEERNVYLFFLHYFHIYIYKYDYRLDLKSKINKMPKKEKKKVFFKII